MLNEQETKSESYGASELRHTVRDLRALNDGCNALINENEDDLVAVFDWDACSAKIVVELDGRGFPGRLEVFAGAGQSD